MMKTHRCPAWWRRGSRGTWASSCTCPTAPAARRTAGSGCERPPGWGTTNTDVGKIFGNTKKYLLLPLPEEAVPAVALPAERVVLVAHLEAGQPPPAHCLFLKIEHLFECITLNITQWRFCNLFCMFLKKYFIFYILTLFWAKNWQKLRAKISTVLKNLRRRRNKRWKTY